MSNNIINICESSLKKLKSILVETNKDIIGISIKSGACSGIKYNIQPIDNRYINDKYINLNDVAISICPKSLIYIAGTNIKWETKNMSSGFVFDNPNAKGTCGCGSSFNI
tara:strand:+ start:30 stop:359 length:330 start_codon:yes stop_codon:yes gene_type:complete